ncbi:MAG: quinol dehydrogenase ferredoxin subunit NapH [Hyphomicrobiales bacterium]|nr:quinol dehydrogenase ferredoxin subunit NapH [Hyphomicrobiales bacterium]
MSVKRNPGREARRRHGWLTAHRWLLARRVAQAGFILLFAAGPWLGLWLVKGSLASSLTLDLLPLTDPLILLQSLVARHKPETTALLGAAIVLATYLVLGGRLYCSWVCPINAVTDLAAWARRRLGIETGWKMRSSVRYWMLGTILVASAVTGTIVFELVNPITTLYRGLLYGVSWGMLSVVLILLFDLLVANHGWCGHICPVGAFYGILNRPSLLRVSATGRERCDDCMDCYAVCPEMHVIAPALKGARHAASPIIASADCTACGRCIDVCPERVFRFTHRFDHRLDAAASKVTAAASSTTTLAA